MQDVWNSSATEALQTLFFQCPYNIAHTVKLLLFDNSNTV